MEFAYVKALHIVFVVCWFAALFYIVRLFIYASEAQTREEPVRKALTDQLLLMQRRLWYIIGWPALVGSYVFGVWLLMSNFAYYFSQSWMWLKLICLAALTVYHLQCQSILTQQKKGVFKYRSFVLRLFNELATVLLVAIVFLVVVKSQSGLLWGLLGLFGFAGILMFAASLYNRQRKKTEQAAQTETNENKENQG